MNKYLFLLVFLPNLSTGKDLPKICLGNDDICYIGSWLSSDSSNYASFQGIRYAQPPIDELRFLAPKPYTDKKGTYDVGNESTVICPQLDYNGVVGQEDCLLLNIYVPETAILNHQKKFPVMFWIYGGALILGDNTFQNYGPKQFMEMGGLLDRETILVAVNYRLGPLGFLSMNSDLVPGNAGMKDQVMALNWVKDNIAKFGGDPDIVTIFGESAGSLSVAMHIISPHSKGLFKRAILQSGTAIGPAWGTSNIEGALYNAIKLSVKLNCYKNGTIEWNEVLTCIQNKSMEDIVAATNPPTDYAYGYGLIWQPVQDNDFLPGDPEELMKSGNFNSDVEVIIGTNGEEGLLRINPYLFNPSLWEDTKENIETVLPMTLFNIATNDSITSKNVVDMYTILNNYIGSVENFNEDHKEELIDMFTDSDFLYGTYKTIRYFLDQNMTVFPYILTYQGTYSPNGVDHGHDIMYLFDPCFGRELNLTDTDIVFRNDMSSAWINFANLGDPAPPGSGITWTATNSPNKFFNFSLGLPTMTTNPEIRKRMELWDHVYNSRHLHDKNSSSLYKPSFLLAIFAMLCKFVRI